MQRLNRKTSKKPILCLDLVARQKSEEYRTYFRLPQREIIDGTIKGKVHEFKSNSLLIFLRCNFSTFPLANLWTPYSKSYVGGSIYLSNNFFCFSSDVKDFVSVVIPLKVIKVNKI